MTDSIKYKYHCQHQAENFARGIIAVPEKYPLMSGLPEIFGSRFEKLCELTKKIYLDMAKQPEGYGLMLVDIASNDHNLARDGYRTIHRFADTLSNLARCGELKDHKMIVDVGEFKKAVKKGAGLVSGPVPKYELILSRLVDFGFDISDFSGKPFGKNAEAFTVGYPDFPEMIDTIKSYCGCWEKLKANKSAVKISPGGFHHHFYRFDYKITSDLEKIPTPQWVSDEADYTGYSAGEKAFSLAFYEYSLFYKDINFDGDYNYKNKRIARIWQSKFRALGQSKFLFSVKIKSMDRYTAVLDGMPENIKKLFRKDCCNFCNFQGATPESCKFRVRWTFEGISHVGCAHACFNFDNFDIKNVPYYWKLLESEYKLQKNA